MMIWPQQAHRTCVGVDPTDMIGEMGLKSELFEVICTCERAIPNDKKKRKKAEERLSCKGRDR